MSETPTPASVYTHGHVLMPLAITVIIDNKIRDPEMAEFCSQANELFPLFGLTTLSEDKIISWFSENEATISEKLSGPRKNTTILIALTRFTQDLHVENLYEAMVAISICDNEYKREESELIQSAASIWGYNRPPIKVVE